MEDSFSLNQWSGWDGFGFTHRSPPAVQSGSYWAMNRYWSLTWGLGAPAVDDMGPSG